MDQLTPKQYVFVVGGLVTHYGMLYFVLHVSVIFTKMIAIDYYHDNYHIVKGSGSFRCNGKLKCANDATIEQHSLYRTLMEDSLLQSSTAYMRI